MEHDTGAVYSGVLYEVSGLVDSLDLTTDPTDIRLSEDCTQVRSSGRCWMTLVSPDAETCSLTALLATSQHVFNGRTLHQPFPKHGRSLREWVRYVLVTEAQATRAHSPLALNSCALPPPAQLKIHFLSRGQARTHDPPRIHLSRWTAGVSTAVARPSIVLLGVPCGIPPRPPPA